MDLAVAIFAYFFIGYAISASIYCLTTLEALAEQAGDGLTLSNYNLVKFFLLTTCATGIPTIIASGVAERA